MSCIGPRNRGRNECENSNKEALRGTAHFSQDSWDSALKREFLFLQLGYARLNNNDDNMVPSQQSHRWLEDPWQILTLISHEIWGLLGTSAKHTVPEPLIYASQFPTWIAVLYRGIRVNFGVRALSDTNCSDCKHIFPFWGSISSHTLGWNNRSYPHS